MHEVPPRAWTVFPFFSFTKLGHLSNSRRKSMQLFSVLCRECQLLAMRLYDNCVRSLRWSARDSLLSICMQNSCLIVMYSLTINILVPPASIGQSCNNTGYFYLHLLNSNNTREWKSCSHWPGLRRENPIWLDVCRSYVTINFGMESQVSWFAASAFIFSFICLTDNY